MSAKDRKENVRNLLKNNDSAGLVALADRDRQVVNTVNRLLYDDDPLVRWRAVKALGWLAAHDYFLLDKVIGRLVYTLNEDSGSIGWMTPQALGEICAADPDLVEDFFPIVLSSIKVEVFRAGVIWAVGRVAPSRPDLVEDTGPALLVALTDPNPEVRGLACWALGTKRDTTAINELTHMMSDPGRLSFFDGDHLGETTVAELARQALEQLHIPVGSRG